jgi:hypothetical protein
MKPDIRRKGLITTLDYGPRKKKVVYKRTIKQRPVSVKYNGAHTYWLDPRPLKVRIKATLRHFWKRTKYYTKFTLYVGTAATIAAIFCDAAIQTHAVAAPLEAGIVKDQKTFLVHDNSVPKALKNIQTCESRTGHYEVVNGKKVFVQRTNTDGSKDWGAYQINDKRWQAEAEKHGWNIHTPEGNEAMAMYLYETYGVRPWYLSVNCWLKK